jgi:dynein heavy chain
LLYQVADEKFLVLINDLLASGEIPDLMSDDDIENIINAMRPEVKGVGIEDSRENCWRWFISKVRRLLKASLVFMTCLPYSELMYVPLVPRPTIHVLSEII